MAPALPTACRRWWPAFSRAAGSVAADSEAIKRNFFLRGFFKRRGYYSLTHFNRTKYAASKFVRNPEARIWLPAEHMFVTDNGEQQLSEEGLNPDLAGTIPVGGAPPAGAGVPSWNGICLALVISKK